MVLKTWSLVAAVLITLSACGTQNLLYRTDKYSLEYPTEWQVFGKNENDLRELDTVFFKFNVEKEVIASISIFTKKLVLEGDFEEYLKQEIESLNQIEGYAEIEVEKFKIAEIETLLHTFKASDGDVQKEFLQTYLPGTDELYILTASVGVEPESVVLSEIKKIFKSFKLKEVEESKVNA